MTNGENYDGAIESAKQLIKLGKTVKNFYFGKSIPKDPHEVIALAKKVRKEQEIKKEADQAREYIKKTWKDEDRQARLRRRAKLKKILGIKNETKN